MVNLMITIAFVVLAVWLLNKGLNATVLFLALGLVVALGYTMFTGESVAAETSGSILLDIFESFKEILVGAFSTTGLAMLPIYAYSVYMNRVGASNVLGSIIAKPISKTKNPYFVGIFITVMVCGLLRIAIVSAVAVMALFMSTLYPALLKSGISRTSAISAIFLGTCFDWGPADFTIAQMFSSIPDMTLSDYFFGASLKVVPIVLVITALTSGFIMQMIDKKSGYVLGSDAPAESEIKDELKLPGFYAVLPLLPLILILVFSPLFIKNLNISVLTTVLLSILLVFIIELVRKRDLKERINDILKWIEGFGEGFSNLLMVVVSISFFAGMLGKIRGFDFLVDTALNAGISGTFLLLVLGIITLVTCLLIGNGGVVAIMLAPQLIGIASSMGISFYAAALPVQTANSLRCFNPGTGPHLQYTSRVADTTAISIFKHLAIPSIMVYILTFVFSMILL